MKKRVRFRFENKIYEIDVNRQGDQLTITGEGQSLEVTLLPEAVRKVKAEEKAQERIAQAPTYTPEPVQTAPPTAASAGAGGALVAPMTGVIKELKVGVGHSVQTGQVVLVMEAMKMDIDVPAVAPGVVAEISVRPGDSVEARQRLMVIA